MNIMRYIMAFLLFLAPCASLAQQSRTPVSLSRVGQDQVGALFQTALKQELAHSTRYIPRHAEGAKGKFEFDIELVTLDISDSEAQEGRRSVVSVVIEDFGLPNSYPVPDMWYHKVIVVDKDTVGRLAKDLLDDMEARWCSYIKDSVGGCPKEKLYPQIH